jgi:hypothetical protein
LVRQRVLITNFVNLVNCEWSYLYSPSPANLFQTTPAIFRVVHNY